jgi:hypothetical protein
MTVRFFKLALANAVVRRPGPRIRGNRGEASRQWKPTVWRRCSSRPSIGATPFIGKNGEDVVAKFDQTGVYGVKRRPHCGMGMAAMILVGSPPNVDQAKALRKVR